LRRVESAEMSGTGQNAKVSEWAIRVRFSPESGLTRSIPNFCKAKPQTALATQRQSSQPRLHRTFATTISWSQTPKADAPLNAVDESGRREAKLMLSGLPEIGSHREGAMAGTFGDWRVVAREISDPADPIVDFLTRLLILVPSKPSQPSSVTWTVRHVRTW
jgi:hypothetical protein